jgi:ribosomal protein L14E/L6E/L27E
MTEIKKGDIVHVEGASAILGDVREVTEDGVTVTWRETTTCEQEDDLVLDDPEERELRREEAGDRRMYEHVFGEENE